MLKKKVLLLFLNNFHNHSAPNVFLSGNFDVHDNMHLGINFGAKTFNGEIGYLYNDPVLHGIGMVFCVDKNLTLSKPLSFVDNLGLIFKFMIMDYSICIKLYLIMKLELSFSHKDYLSFDFVSIYIGGRLLAKDFYKKKSDTCFSKNCFSKNIAVFSSAKDKDILNRIEDFIKSPSSQFMLIGGESGSGKTTLIQNNISKLCSNLNVNFSVLPIEGTNTGGYVSPLGDFHEIINNILSKATDYDAACGTVFSISEVIKTFGMKGGGNDLRGDVLVAMLQFIDGRLLGLTYNGQEITPEDAKFKFIFDDSCSTILREKSLYNDYQSLVEKHRMIISNFLKNCGELQAFSNIDPKQEINVVSYRFLYDLIANDLFIVSNDVNKYDLLNSLLISMYDGTNILELLKKKMTNIDFLNRVSDYVMLIGSPINLDSMVAANKNSFVGTMNQDQIKNMIASSYLFNKFQNTREIINKAKKLNNLFNVNPFPFSSYSQHIADEDLNKYFLELELIDQSDKFYSIQSTVATDEFLTFASQMMSYDMIFNFLANINKKAYSDKFIEIAFEFFESLSEDSIEMAKNLINSQLNLQSNITSNEDNMRKDFLEKELLKIQVIEGLYKSFKNQKNEKEPPKFENLKALIKDTKLSKENTFSIKAIFGSTFNIENLVNEKGLFEKLKDSYVEFNKAKESYRNSNEEFIKLLLKSKSFDDENLKNNFTLCFEKIKSLKKDMAQAKKEYQSISKELYKVMNIVESKINNIKNLAVEEEEVSSDDILRTYIQNNSSYHLLSETLKAINEVLAFYSLSDRCLYRNDYLSIYHQFKMIDYDLKLKNTPEVVSQEEYVVPQEVNEPLVNETLDTQQEGHNPDAQQNSEEDEQ